MSKPRDLSGGDQGGNSIPLNSGRRVLKPTGATPRGSGRERQGGGATNRDSKIAQNMSQTMKPDFVPSLTIPSEGMVNGKLNVA